LQNIVNTYTSDPKLQEFILKAVTEECPPHGYELCVRELHNNLIMMWDVLKDMSNMRGSTGIGNIAVRSLSYDSNSYECNKYADDGIVGVDPSRQDELRKFLFDTCWTLKHGNAEKERSALQEQQEKVQAEVFFCINYALTGIRETIERGEVDGRDQIRVDEVTSKLFYGCVALRKKMDTRTASSTRSLIHSEGKVCYQYYGCFGERMPHIDTLPEPPDVIRPEFIFIHQHLPKVVISEENYHLIDELTRSRQPDHLAIVMHGFNSDIDDTSYDLTYYNIADAMASSTPYKNVILMRYTRAMAGAISYKQVNSAVDQTKY
jgi:hypothetical protein